MCVILNITIVNALLSHFREKIEKTTDNITLKKKILMDHIMR